MAESTRVQIGACVYFNAHMCISVCVWSCACAPSCFCLFKSVCVIRFVNVYAESCCHQICERVNKLYILMTRESCLVSHYKTKRCDFP